MMGQSRWVHLEEVRVLRETENDPGAFLVNIDGTEYWVPRSQTCDPDNVKVDKDSEVTLTVSEWWAKKAGFEIED